MATAGCLQIIALERVIYMVIAAALCCTFGEFLSLVIFFLCEISF